MIFIETSVFTRQVRDLLSDEDYTEFQSELAANPLAGALIEGTGGLRKVWVAAKDKGKSGGARVIYYYMDKASQIRLLLISPKDARTVYRRTRSTHYGV